MIPTMSILAHFYLLTVTLLKPSDLGESLCLCGARFFKLKPAELPGDFLQLFLTLWVGPAMVTSMMVTKPCRGTKNCTGTCKEDEKLKKIIEIAS